MADPIVYSLAPLRINATVLATAGLQVPPDVASEAFRHSGNEFASALVVPGAAPRVRFRTPFKAAYDLIGFKILPVTTLDIYFAKFAASIRDPNSTHAKYSLAVSAKAVAFIRSFSVAHGGIAMAEVEVVLLSSDGMAHPFAAPATAALPTLAAQPTLHTMGTTSINGTAIAGAVDASVDLAPNVMIGIDGTPGDGLLYPTVATYLGGAPSIEVGHGDPITLLATLGLTGVAVGASTFKQWLREFDATTQLALSTGVSLTIASASGRMIPVDFGADNQSAAKGGLRIEGLSTSTTHPIAVGTGTVP
ncbi:hypothetical protein [Methylibium sp.]|uniref:hypothetical protein n=1 Tax=Methylibium sp. TaxID=2067992 RepID=UPI0017AC80A4|nr:hypothetical protein [Methylibium sp.]MBA3591564.1 hypothetical protein [Methylibium sp.]